MSMALLLVLQAAAPVQTPPIHFDLAKLKPGGSGLTMPAFSRRCERGDSSEIVVCGRRYGGGYRVVKLSSEFEPKPTVAEAGLVGNVTGNVHLESVQFPNGEVSNRVMIGFKLPF